jgi:hypothetical protein
MTTEPEALYFLWGDRSTGRCSYVWRIGTGRTSFYLKAIQPSLASVKISLHGPDERHRMPGFKFAFDRSAIPTATAAGGRIIGDFGNPWYPGEDFGGGTRLAVRFRVESSLFKAPSPSAPWPTKEIRNHARGLVIPPPDRFSVADVDIFVTKGHPFWPNEEDARANKACIGPLRNEADQFLTGVSYRRPANGALRPPTELSLPIDDDDASPRVRAIGARVGGGLLWIVEQSLPNWIFDDPSFAPAFLESL